MASASGAAPLSGIICSGRADVSQPHLRGQRKRQVCAAYLAVLSWGLTEVLSCGPQVGGCAG